MPAGSLVYVRSGVKRTAFAEKPGTTILVVGGEPGKAYEVNGWEHLRQAIDLSEQFRDYAKGDSDFDPIREEPGFKQLLGA